MKKIFTVFVLLLAFFSMALNAGATTYSFTDNHIYWPGWAATVDAYGPDNTRDVIGEPMLSGGSFTVEDGKLTEVIIEGAGYDTNLIKAGDLFLSTDGDSTWDYIVHNTGAGWNIYGGSIALNSTTAYLITGNDVTPPWSGYDIRNQHPFALDGIGGLTLLGSASFSGLTEGSTSYNNFGGVIGVTGPVTVGWTVTCANDVIYEQVPVPEPATMLLLGLGLVGVGLLRRRS